MFDRSLCAIARLEKGQTEVQPASGVPLILPLIVTVRSEEHTSELQSRFELVCRLLLEKKKYRSYCPGAVVERIPTPGAATRAPRFENGSSLPAGVKAPTEIRLSLVRDAGTDGR